MLLATIGMLGAIGTTLLLPWPLTLIIDYVILAEPFPVEVSFITDWFGTNPWVLIFILSLSIIVITFFNALLSYIHGYYFAVASERLTIDVRQRVFYHLQFLSLSYFKSSQAGDVIYRLTSDIQDLKMVLITGPWVLIRRTISVSAIIVVMVLLERRLALVAVAIIPIIFFYAIRFGSGVNKATKKKKKKESKVASVVSENITAMALVQAYGQEHVEKDRFDQQNVASVEAQVSAIRISKAFKRFTKILVAVGTAAVVYFGSLSVLAGVILPGTLVLFVSYLRKLYSPADKSAMTLIDMSRAMVSVDRILALIDNDLLVEDSPQAVTAPPFKGKVEFDNVTFAYNHGVDVIKNQSFVAPPGRTTALVGHSGAGKTTLLSLLMRFYEPQQGKIYFDGRNIADFTHKSLREQMTIVFQDAMLLNMTIRENIAYGHPQATEAEIIAAAKQANAHDFIVSLADGYNTIVEEGGENLSGGQRQRISIARAILRNTPILILDEPVTGLDAKAEAEVNEAFRQLAKGKTTYVIAHRFSTIRNADNILLLEEGKILEEGNHEWLMQSSPIYRELYKLQSGAQEANGQNGHNMTLSPLPESLIPPFTQPLPSSAGLAMQGVKLRLNSNCQPLVEYMSEHICDFALPEVRQPEIEVNVLWLDKDEYDPAVHHFPDLDQLDRIGKRLLADEQQLVWLDILSAKGLQMRFRLDGEKFCVDAIYHFKPSSSKPLETHDAYRYKKFFSLMKYFVYFPLAWYLEHFFDLYLLHASAVQLNGKAIIIAGVGGVGKTTTSMALLAQDGAQLISENLIFYDANHIYSCYEPIRADDGSVAMLGSLNGHLKSGRILSRVKEKNLFHVMRNQIVEQTQPSALFIPKFSSKAGVVSIDPDICVEQLLAINMQTREVNAYYWFAATLDLVWPKGDRSQLRTTQLIKLISKTEVYELNIDPTGGVEPVIEMILQHGQQK